MFVICCGVESKKERGEGERRCFGMIYMAQCRAPRWFVMVCNIAIPNSIYEDILNASNQSIHLEPQRKMIVCARERECV